MHHGRKKIMPNCEQHCHKECDWVPLPPDVGRHDHVHREVLRDEIQQLPMPSLAIAGDNDVLMEGIAPFLSTLCDHGDIACLQFSDLEPNDRRKEVAGGAGEVVNPPNTHGQPGENCQKTNTAKAPLCYKIRRDS